MSKYSRVIEEEKEDKNKSTSLEHLPSGTSALEQPRKITVLTGGKEIMTT